MTRDRRYSSRRWTQLARQVRGRDQWTCFVPGCDRGGEVADHIVPTTLATPDAEFFDPSGLRAACRKHNNLRGFQTAAAREFADVPVPAARPRTPYARRPTPAALPDPRPMMPTVPRYHIHPGPTGPQLLGDMSARPPWPSEDGCPPECQLLRAI